MTTELFKVSKHKESVKQAIKDGLSPKEVLAHFPVSRSSFFRWQKEVDAEAKIVFEIIDKTQVPPMLRRSYPYSPILTAVRELPPGKALKIEVSSHEKAVKPQRSLLSNPAFHVSTRIGVEQERYYLYVWKREE